MKYFLLPFALLSLFLTGSCSSEEEEQSEIIRPVRYIVVGENLTGKSRSFNGTAKAVSETELSFRASGIITEIKVQSGQVVKKGDLIARLDNLEAQLAYEKSLAALKSAESDMNVYLTEFNRTKTLYEKNSVSLSEYQLAKNKYENAKSNFETAKKNVELQKTQLGYGIIRAPLDGIIASTNGELNERVAAGHVFAILNAGDQMKIELGIPENLINNFNVGLEAEIQFSSIKGKTFKGNVGKISPNIDPNTSTFPVDILIEERSAAIKTGMAAKLTFTFPKQETSSNITVPLNAIGEDDQGNFAFVVEPENDTLGIARKVYVKLEGMTNAGFLIEEGLNSGDFLVTAGLQTLFDGQKVRLTN